MKLLPLLGEFVRKKPGTVRLLAAVSFFIVVVSDWYVEKNLSIGFLYLIPIALAALVTGRISVCLVAAVSTFLREQYAPFAWSPDWPIRLLMVWFAFTATGLLVWEMNRGRVQALTFAGKIAHESALRGQAEEQTRTVLETSPLAILDVHESGRIALANKAAHLLFSSPEHSLLNDEITRYLPNLKSLFDAIEELGVQTMLESRGVCRDGSVFLAQIWCSARRTQNRAVQWTLVVWDASDSLRDREEAGLQAFLTMPRIVMGAVSHEIRNMAAAAGVAYGSLKARKALVDDQDFKALGMLIEALEGIARKGLATSGRVSDQACDLLTIFDELRIVIAAKAADAGVLLEFETAAPLPKVLGEHVRLLQVFLNLTSNSIQAMQGISGPRALRIHAAAQGASVIVDVKDTGPGVPSPGTLFRPFQAGSQGSGLGLCVSRAIVRSFGGDLRYLPAPSGAWFQMTLSAADARRTRG